MTSLQPKVVRCPTHGRRAHRPVHGCRLTEFHRSPRHSHGSTLPTVHSPAAHASSLHRGRRRRARGRAGSRLPICQRQYAGSSSPPARSSAALQLHPCWLDPATPGSRLEFPSRLTDHGVAWRCLLLYEHGGGEFDSLPAFFNTCAQKKCAQMLFDGARADAQMARDFLVAASLNEQTQYLLVSGRYLDIVKIDHWLFV